MTVNASPLAGNQRQQLTRQRIIDAATSLFIRRGVAAVSVEDILLEVDLSRGTFYKYFSSKEDVLKAIIIPVFENLINRFSLLGSAHESIIFEEVLHSYFQQWQTNSGALVLAFNIGPANFSLVHTHHDRYVELLNNLIGRMHGLNLLRLDEPAFSSILIARCVVPVLQSLQKSRNLESDFIATMQGMLLR
jgi:AcrR family transcriptional regulator